MKEVRRGLGQRPKDAGKIKVDVLDPKTTKRLMDAAWEDNLDIRDKQGLDLPQSHKVSLSWKSNF